MYPVIVPRGDATLGCRPARKKRGAATVDYAATAAVLKALADPTRLEIVHMVARSDAPLCACEIESHFELSQSTISHHLGVLKKAEVLTSERRGTWAFFSLTPAAAASLQGVARVLEG